MMSYGNSQKEVKGLATKIKNHLDFKGDLSKYDVVVIHCHQSKEVKSAFLKHFYLCNCEKMNLKIACATSGVANTGIDCKDV